MHPIYYITVAIAIESSIIDALAIIWLVHNGPLENVFLYAAILLSAISMSVQSAAIWHLDIPGVVTTFMTGNMASIGMSIIGGLRQGFTKKIKSTTVAPAVNKNLEDRITIQLMVLFTYIFSVIFTGWMEFHEAEFLPLLPLLLILCVLVILIRHSKNQPVTE